MTEGFAQIWGSGGNVGFSKSVASKGRFETMQKSIANAVGRKVILGQMNVDPAYSQLEVRGIFLGIRHKYLFLCKI